MTASPGLMEVIVANGEELPPPELPYYVFAQEGLFIHKKTEIGRVIVKAREIPYTVASIGEDKNGVFFWTGDKIPGHIIGQATAFFRRIYEKHHTEAEVLIVRHTETGEYRLFIPYQRTSGAGVKSVFEPTHVDPNYMIVGTLHSHCMMNAFHSGTDTGDAADMDGVHFTIGKVLNDTPEIVAMVSMNKQNFHYHDPSVIAEVEFDGHPAPEWWDNYVYPTGSPSEKPKSLKSITQAIWDEFRGIIHKPANQGWQGNAGGWRGGNYAPHNRGSEDNDWGMRGYSSDNPHPGWQPGENRLIPFKGVSQITAESAAFNARQNSRRAEKNAAKEEQRKLARERKQNKARRENAAARDSISGNHWAMEGSIEAAEWMTISLALDEAEEGGVFHDSDWNDFNANDLDDLGHWRGFFIRRMRAVTEVLDTLGLEVAFKVATKDKTEATPSVKELPGQTHMDDYIGGAL